MTRPSQKKSERQTLDAVLAALGLRPEQEPEASEAPDFTMLLSGRVIGLEITLYRSGEAVANGSKRRAVEGEWELLKAASDAFRSQHPDLRNINVGLMFKDTVPPRRRHAAFLEEIAAFVRSCAAELTSSDLECWPPSFLTPLMRAYLCTLYVRQDQFAQWHSNLAAGYVGLPS